MKRLAIVLTCMLILSGCASPGPLPDGRWFLTNPPSEGPIVFLARGLANAGLAMVYVAASVADSFGNGHSWREKERQYQLSRPP